MVSLTFHNILIWTRGVLFLNRIMMNTHLQCDSPRGEDAQRPAFLQGLGEHDTKPEIENIFHKHEEIKFFESN